MAALVPSAAAAPDAADADRAATSEPAAGAAARCVRAAIGGRTVCLRRGARCRRRFNRSYFPYGLACRRTKRGFRLGKASLRQSRGNGAIAVDPKTGRVSKAAALQAIVHLYGPVPGVRAQRGAVGRIRSGTGPLRWIRRVRGQLNRAQRRAVDRLTADRPVRAQAAAHSKGEVELFIGLTASATSKHVGGPVPQIRLKLGAAPAKSKGEEILADADQATIAGKKGCEIRTTAVSFQNLTKAEALATIAHEVWHCFQFQAVGGKVYYAPAWIIEGQAEWVGLAIGEEVLGQPVTGDKAVGWWARYLKSPKTGLFSRTYDALGFYGELAYLSLDPWPRLVPMLKAPGSGPAYTAAVGAADTPLRQNWPSSFFRRSDFGPPWTLAGSSVTTDRLNPPTFDIVNGGKPGTLSAPARANDIGEFRLQADVVRITVTGQGSGRIRFLDGSEQVLQIGAYCTAVQGCQPCPQAGGQAPPPAPRGIARLALSAGSGGAVVVVSGLTDQAHCSQQVAGNACSNLGTYEGAMRCCYNTRLVNRFSRCKSQVLCAFRGRSCDRVAVRSSRALRARG